MSDVTVLPTGGTTGGGGGTNWLLVGGAGIGVLVLVMMMRGKGAAGQPTTAAGTSINAALGSIQEQNLNVMGEVGQSEQRLSTELGNVNGNIIAGNANLANLSQGDFWQTQAGLQYLEGQPAQAAADAQQGLTYWLQYLPGFNAKPVGPTPVPPVPNPNLPFSAFV